MNRLWWITGVKFSCQTGCGKCCDEPGGIVYLSRHDAKRISSSMGMSVDDWLARDCKQTYDGRYILKSRKSDGICIYLSEDKTCNIYQNRPQQCAAYPWWSENLATDRSWQQTKLECPGLTAEDAIVVDGNTIKIHVLADRQSTKGFKQW